MRSPLLYVCFVNLPDLLYRTIKLSGTFSSLIATLIIILVEIISCYFCKHINIGESDLPIAAIAAVIISWIV